MSEDPNADDVLDVLFVDRRSLDKKLLVRLIQSYIQLYSDTPEVVTTPSWSALTIQQKVLTFLLGRKALRVKGLISEEEEKISPSKLEISTGIKGGSLRPTLSKLLDDRLLRQDDNGYWIPDHALTQIEPLLNKEKNK